MISGLQSSHAAHAQRQNKPAVAKKPLATNVQFGIKVKKEEQEPTHEPVAQEPKKPAGVLERLVNRIIQFIDRLQKTVEEFFKNVAEHLKKNQEQMSAQLAARQAELAEAAEHQAPTQDIDVVPETTGHETPVKKQAKADKAK